MKVLMVDQDWLAQSGGVLKSLPLRQLGDLGSRLLQAYRPWFNRASQSG